ncbi:sugar ABC transporter permease [Enterococcus dispar]|uniref:Maltodextrin transport system permease protein MalD n=1 Tax=Enterococcus dispar ATCC 51266 TaxID=1139219 RepID=S0K2B6_9ENTE|nr:sugar ABC transporter permease [Enterococcus dispar]EOT39264.1 ABC transporter permease [Enterococcus dispar ATCC 51266]EOW86321.1 ABC transporter permease [Enterococcus dispar ATCC 51266]OJG39318.1 ABC transporter permease [Enterococcus dispar]
MKKILKKSNFFTYFILIFASIIIIFPLLITIISAFTVGNVVAFKLEFHNQWTLSNFTRLFSESMYGQWYVNTLIIAVGTMVFQVITVTLSGYVYSRYSFIGKKQSLIFFLIVQMIPTMSALTAFYVMGLLANGLDQYWFLTLIYIGGGIPMNTWLMKGYFDTIPISLDESAKLDGAGSFRIFAQIVAPLVKPMIAVQALWAFMTPFGDYMLSKFLLRSPDRTTVAVGLQTFINDTRNQRVTLFAAGAILVALPIAALFFYLQKYFVAGLSNGGVKG